MSINKKISPFYDEEITRYFKEKKLNLIATTDASTAFNDAEIVIIATPTDYDASNDFFETSSIDGIIKLVNKYNKKAIVLIKSTIPIGYTDLKRFEYPDLKIIFSPEFLSEGRALHDALFPERIIVGDKTEIGRLIGNLFANCSPKKDIIFLYVNSKEAECIKLFANTYLAMRIAFFNELDTYTNVNDLSSKDVIRGVGLDSRIGLHYNNPSFGYGGYCLPKDSMQLLSHYKGIPQSLISAVVSSNIIRKDFIFNEIKRRNAKKIGIFRLIAKTDSDNFRNSSSLELAENIFAGGYDILVYEPLIKDRSLYKFEITDNISYLKEVCDLIIANRITEEIRDVREKIFTRDLFHKL